MLPTASPSAVVRSSRAAHDSTDQSPRTGGRSCAEPRPTFCHPERSRGISRRVATRLLVPFLALSLAPPCFANPANWPGVAEWRALTNHITECYEAITQRCEAINRPDLYPDSPTYYRPMDDYANFAQAIDNIAPHFVCQAMGTTIIDIMRGHPTRQLTVYCGHTHGGGETRPLPNVVIHTGAAEYGVPAITKQFSLPE